MLFSRWKLFTGALGLSIGGLATFGGQTPKPADSPLMVRADEKPLPPPPSVAQPVSPAAIVLPTVPSVVPPSFPGTPPSAPVIELPGLPLPDSKPTETKLPPSTKPVTTMDLAVLPVSGVTLPPLPSAPPPPISALSSNPPVTPSLPPMPKPSPFVLPELPDSLPPMPKPSPFVSQELPPSLPPMPAPTAPPVTVSPSKFRIVLRVGNGEATFEVRHDDDLVMKVVCEKVDIKSREKGQGPSSITATGNVRFVGFGAEGSCESLSFLAGTGEVSLVGNVNVKVRDKIGRVESELHADKMKYKLDQNALTGAIKP